VLITRFTASEMLKVVWSQLLNMSKISRSATVVDVIMTVQ